MTDQTRSQVIVTSRRQWLQVASNSSVLELEHNHSCSALEQFTTGPNYMHWQNEVYDLNYCLKLISTRVGLISNGGPIC